MSFDFNDRNYDQYCSTEKQKEALKACRECGSKRAAARKIGIDDKSLRTRLGAIERKASESGYRPKEGMHHAFGSDQKYLKGTFQIDGAGNVQKYWPRMSPDKEAHELIIDALSNYSPKTPPKVKAPKKRLDKNLCSLYTITDYHLGMYAYAQETGDDWDTRIAGEVLHNAVVEMTQKAPNSETAILNFQGDTLHWDGLDAVTPTNRNVLDADTRFDKMIDLAMDMTEWAVLELLKNHKYVHLKVCEGNHDLAGSGWLRKHHKRIWRDHNRVQVDDNSFPYYSYLHHNVMLGFHHGHKKSNNALPKLFSSEPRFRQQWGQAQICYIHTGHYHKAEKILDEENGAIIERHPTLAGRDAHAARGGYVSRRRAHVITYDQNEECERATVKPRHK